MRLQELLPGRPLLSLRSWLNGALPKDGGDGPAANIMAHICERALDPRVAPVTILGRHPDDQLPNLGRHRWPAGPAPVMAVVLLGDQVPMPGEQGVRAHNGPDLPEHPPT